MKKIFKLIMKYLILFVIGGILYYFIEILWRGHSHISMFYLGGICFVLIGLINKFFTFIMQLWKQQLISALLVTALEFIAGLILNVWLNLNVWDYSKLKFNLYGQICLEYSILWYFLSLPTIILDDYLRYWFFNEEKPHYKIF